MAAADDPFLVAKLIGIRNEARARVKKFPGLRYGQCVFNAVYFEFPVLVSSAIGTDIDPFHHDSNVEAFLEYVYGAPEK